jgi:hypothetical protein
MRFRSEIACSSFCKDKSIEEMRYSWSHWSSKLYLGPNNRPKSSYLLKPFRGLAIAPFENGVEGKRDSGALATEQIKKSGRLNFQTRITRTTECEIRTQATAL